jgi:signal transduction histidine kinase
VRAAAIRIARRAPGRDAVSVNDQLAVLLRRPLAAETWQDTWYLVVSFFIGTFGFAIVISVVSTTASLGILIVGLPLAAGAARILRWWCGIERGRASRVLQRPVPARDRHLSGRGFMRWLSILRDAQTWRDVAWMFIAFPVGIVGLVFALDGWVACGALLTSPIWLWSIPGWIHANDVFLSIAFPLISPFAAVLIAWIVRGLAVGRAELAARMLGLSRTEALAQRVQTLSETRAGAVESAVSELQRVERDLHDGAQARLVALAMDLGLAEQRLAGDDPQRAMEHVASARGQARAAMSELRDLVRGIGPSILTDRGLDAALTALVAGRTPPVALQVQWPGTEVGARETAAYFVVAEALANARKHAQASAISVHVWGDAAERLLVEITDDGRGGADPQAGSGLSGLRQRVAAIDGTLTITSPQGGPTTVRAEFPCAS